MGNVEPFAIAVLAGLLSFHPATAQPASDRAALMEAGRQVFLTAGEVGCAACHGPYAEGDVGIGPYNRGVSEAAIRAALEGVEAMEDLRAEMTDSRIKAVAAYYAHLGRLQLFKTIVKRGRFIPDAIEVYPGTEIQLVLKNTSIRPRTFDGREMGAASITIPGRETVDMIWQAPQREGVFELACTNCRTSGGKLTITVTKMAKRHISPTRPPTVQVIEAEAPAPDVPAIVKGRELFLTAGGVGCVACHGRYAEGDVGIGPYNRGFSEVDIRSALKTVRPMNFLADELTDAEISQVAAYYQSLGEQRLIKTRVVRGRFIPARIRIRPGAKIQLVVDNRVPHARRFQAASMGIADFTVAGRDAVDFVWSAPPREGSFTMRCADCLESDQSLTIDVTNAAQQ